MGERNTLQASIKQTLSVKEDTKKQISLVIDSKLLKSLDVITEEFKNLTNGKISSRNQLVELALEEYVKEASVVLLDYGINIEELLVNDIDNEEENSIEEELGDDLVAIFPARNEGFEKVFLGQKEWYSIRVAKWRIKKIAYVACYRTAPYSEITHYAKVKKIEPSSDYPNKYKIIFDGEAIPLPQPIKRGNDITGVRSTRYTTFNKLLKAKELWELQ
jgi:hypothetical protein